MQDNNMHKIDAELYFVIDSNAVELTEKGVDYLSEWSRQKLLCPPRYRNRNCPYRKSGIVSRRRSSQKRGFFKDFGIKGERITIMVFKATLFEKDTEYVVMDNKVMIVDEQTGNVDGRRYSDGLHQAIEAKENVKIEAATQTFATVTCRTTLECTTNFLA